MAPRELTQVESDRRFPSGHWTGFFIQPWIPGRHAMRLDLTFQQGRLEAQGNDWVGPFTFSGSYDSVDGKCTWTKKYLGKHQVSYMPALMKERASGECGRSASSGVGITTAACFTSGRKG
jgi:hypothetical protein